MSLIKGGFFILWVSLLGIVQPCSRNYDDSWSDPSDDSDAVIYYYYWEGLLDSETTITNKVKTSNWILKGYHNSC